MSKYDLSFTENVDKIFTVGIETKTGIVEQNMKFQDAFQRMPNRDYLRIAYVRDYQHSNNGWISIDNANNENLGEVLCISNQNEQLIGYLCLDSKVCESEGEIIDNVTHYQPKPKPPKASQCSHE